MRRDVFDLREFYASPLGGAAREALGAKIGETWGEAVKACVVLRPGATADAVAIIGFMRDRLAHFKCPRSVDFMPALPRNPSGKVLKRVLRQPYWRDRTREVN